MIGAGDDVAGRTILMAWASCVAAIVTAVTLALTGEWLATIAFATTALTALWVVVAAERWRTWRGVADGLLDVLNEPPPES